MPQEHPDVNYSLFSEKLDEMHTPGPAETFNPMRVLRRVFSEELVGSSYPTSFVMLAKRSISYSDILHRLQRLRMTMEMTSNQLLMLK